MYYAPPQPRSKKYIFGGDHAVARSGSSWRCLTHRETVGYWSTESNSRTSASWHPLEQTARFASQGAGISGTSRGGMSTPTCCREWCGHACKKKILERGNGRASRSHGVGAQASFRNRASGCVRTRTRDRTSNRRQGARSTPRFARRVGRVVEHASDGAFDMSAERKEIYFKLSALILELAESEDRPQSQAEPKRIARARTRTRPAGESDDIAKAKARRLLRDSGFSGGRR